MKVKIKKRFRDRDTLKIMVVGTEADYAQDRAVQLAGWGFVELLEAVQEDGQEAHTPGVPAEDMEALEKEEIADSEPEKHDFTPFPEKSEQPKKRGRKPKK